MATSDNSTRITSIDGYRAIAISAVVMHHALSAPGFPAWLEPFARSLPRGVVGFWVLSGFLITRSILLEEQRTGAIQFGRFCLRQAVRYFTPMLAYLLGIGIIVACRYPGFNWWLVVRPAILDPNTFCIAESVSHLYSLVLQIYFWLLWPVVLKNSPPRFRFHAALLLAVVAFAWRSIGQSLAIVSGGCAGRIDFFFTAPLIGCCFALGQPVLLSNVKRCPRIVLIGVAAIFAAILVLTANPATLGFLVAPPATYTDTALTSIPSTVDLYDVITPMAIYLAWGFLVFCLVENLLPAFARFLSSSLLTWLGRISFSVYLWQNLFCQGLTETRLDYFPLNIVASILCGYLAYLAIELPSLRWRSKLKRCFALSPELQPKLSDT